MAVKGIQIRDMEENIAYTAIDGDGDVKYIFRFDEGDPENRDYVFAKVSIDPLEGTCEVQNPDDRDECSPCLEDLEVRVATTMETIWLDECERAEEYMDEDDAVSKLLARTGGDKQTKEQEA